MYTNLDKVFQDPVFKLVSEFGFKEAAERMKYKEEQVRRRIFDLTCEHNPEFFSKHALKIRDKNGMLVPLAYNAGQRKLRQAIDRQVRAGKPVRIKLPKARQFGGSTFVQGEYFGDSLFGQHIQFMTICHDLDSARNMRAMVDRFYSNLPYPPAERPKQKKNSDKWWRFPAKDVDYLIDTADEVDTGRSFTIHRLHASECAFYRDPETLMTALLQAVPDSPNTMIVVESTANGMGGYWYDFINNKNDFEQVFVAWYEIEGYTRNFENGIKKAEFERLLSAEDKNLIDSFGVSLEQLNWKKHTVENQLNGDEDKFRQEYPATVEESFLTSGRPYFKMETVRANLRASEKAPFKIGFLERTDDGVEFIEDRTGLWKILKDPVPGWEYRYVTGTDTSEGKTVDEGNRDPDFTSITVFDRYKNEEAARFYGRVDEDVIADEIKKSTKFYGGSTCDCIERSSSGIAVISILKHDEEINLYQRELVAKTEDKETIEYGFRTGVDTRDFLLSELRTRVRLGSYKSNDKDFWKDCSTFVFNKDGKPQGQSGTHDDRVLSAALALQASLQAAELSPIAPPSEVERPEPDADIPRRQEKYLQYVEF